MSKNYLPLPYSIWDEKKQCQLELYERKWKINSSQNKIEPGMENPNDMRECD